MKVLNNPYVVLGIAAAVVGIYVVNKTSGAISSAAESVGGFVSNENLFSETVDNGISIISDDRFRDLGDVFMWMTGKDDDVKKMLEAPAAPLATPSDF